MDADADEREADNVPLSGEPEIEPDRLWPAL